MTLNEFSELLNGVLRSSIGGLEKLLLKIRYKYSPQLCIIYKRLFDSIVWQFTIFRNTHANTIDSELYLHPTLHESLAAAEQPCEGTSPEYFPLYREFLQLARSWFDHFLADVKLNWSTSPAGKMFWVQIWTYNPYSADINGSFGIVMGQLSLSQNDIMLLEIITYCK